MAYIYGYIKDGVSGIVDEIRQKDNYNCQIRCAQDKQVKVHHFDTKIDEILN